MDQLRVQAARDRDRIEELENRVLVLGDRLAALRSHADARSGDAAAPTPAGAASAPAAEPWGAPPRLEVVRLDPKSGSSPPPAEQQPQEPPVQLTLSGAQHAESVPVVEVPPPPRYASSKKGGEADRAFRAALAAYRKGDGALACERFESFLQRFPHDPNADNALFWMAESRFEAGRFADAAARYRQLVDRFPASSKAPDALLKLGLAYERLGEPGKARKAFEQVVSSHPQSAVADLARSRLGGS